MASFVASSGTIVTGISGRYATALFQLAQDAKQVDKIAASLATLTGALRESADFKSLVTSPLVTRADAALAVAATAKALKLDKLTTNFLGVLASGRRLSALPAIIDDFGQLAAAARGEITARVTSARKLDAKQQAALLDQLKAGLGRDV
ncbi:MAG: ATP synthase F1 subunit delta, partial [Polymorphobacter sp.]